MTYVLKYELASVPPSMFKDNGNTREVVGKSALMNTIVLFIYVDSISLEQVKRVNIFYVC